MDINRIQREFSDAQQSFAYVNLYPTLDGKVYVKAALTAASQTYVFSIKFHWKPLGVNIIQEI